MYPYNTNPWMRSPPVFNEHATIRLQCDSIPVQQSSADTCRTGFHTTSSPTQQIGCKQQAWHAGEMSAKGIQNGSQLVWRRQANLCSLLLAVLTLQQAGDLAVRLSYVGLHKGNAASAHGHCAR